MKRPIAPELLLIVLLKCHDIQKVLILMSRKVCSVVEAVSNQSGGDRSCIRCEGPAQRRHFAACKRQKGHKCCWIAPVFRHMLSSLRGKNQSPSLPTGFLLIQLVFAVLLRSKTWHISTALTWTKDTHSRNLVFRRWMAKSRRDLRARTTTPTLARSGLHDYASKLFADQLIVICPKNIVSVGGDYSTRATL